MIEIKKSKIDRVTTKVNKAGEVIAKVVMSFNLTATGDLTKVADLVAMQDQNVCCRFETEQMKLDLEK